MCCCAGVSGGAGLRAPRQNTLLQMPSARARKKKKKRPARQSAHLRAARLVERLPARPELDAERALRHAARRLGQREVVPELEAARLEAAAAGGAAGADLGVAAPRRRREHEVVALAGRVLGDLDGFGFWSGGSGRRGGERGGCDATCVCVCEKASGLENGKRCEARGPLSSPTSPPITCKPKPDQTRPGRATHSRPLSPRRSLTRCCRNSPLSASGSLNFQ